MHTARLLTVSPSMQCTGGWWGCWRGGVCLWSKGVVSASGPRGSASGPRGSASGPVGGYPSMQWGRPPVDRILDTRFRKYYFAPASLRAVKCHEMKYSLLHFHGWLDKRLQWNAEDVKEIKRIHLSKSAIWTPKVSVINGYVIIISRLFRVVWRRGVSGDQLNQDTKTHVRNRNFKFSYIYSMKVLLLLEKKSIKSR